MFWNKKPELKSRTLSGDEAGQMLLARAELKRELKNDLILQIVLDLQKIIAQEIAINALELRHYCFLKIGDVVKAELIRSRLERN